MTEDFTRSELLALLAWWREAGVTDALDEPAVDWVARGETVPGRDFVWPERAPPARTSDVPRGAGPGPRPVVPVSTPADRGSGPPQELSSPAARPTSPSGPGPGPQLRAPQARGAPAGSNPARQSARQARSLEELEALLGNFDGCALKATAKSLCFYRGSPQARVMVIGEAPGRDEDIAGKPFVGRAGQLLDRMLAAIDLAEADVHITNIVYWRPPGNRTPTPEEAQACRPFLERQMELVGPDFVLTLGGPAAKAVLEANEGIMRLRGKWREIEVGGRKARVMPTLHPAYLLRQPDAKRQAWHDLLALRIALDEQPQGKAP